MKNTTIEEPEVRDANPDPITGEPGSHPVGTGLGSAGGAAAGAAVGAAVGGPVGALVGGVAGAVAGGGAGHAMGEGVNPTVEEGYWRENYVKRPYARPGSKFEDYYPAYKYGWESASRPTYKNRKFDEVESDLGRGWDKAKGTSRHTWEDARMATKDAWHHVRGEKY